MHLLFDIGGTRTRISVSSELHSFQDPVIIDTPKTPQEGMVEIKNALASLTSDKVTISSGGFAGVIDKHTGEITNSPNLPDWIGFNLSLALNQFSQKCIVDNDSAVVGLGEAVYGAGKNHKIVVYITISTGVGGVRIVNKQIDTSTYGFEPGHQIVQIIQGDTKTQFVEIEELISGTSATKRFGDPDKIFTIAQEKEKFVDYASTMLNNTIAHWSPEIVVLGGGVSKSKLFPLEDIVRKLEEIMTIFPEKPAIALAELDSVGGLYGAMAQIKDLV